jgi:hypothetical protein
MSNITFCNLSPKECEVMKFDLPDGAISLLIAERGIDGEVVHLLLSAEQWDNLKGITGEIRNEA